jgi:hypothetical protein
MDAFVKMYEIRNNTRKMHLKNCLQALTILEDTILEGYLWEFKTLKSQLVAINMPMVEEDLVEVLLNALFESYHSYVDAPLCLSRCLWGDCNMKKVEDFYTIV